jgi:hypothetical protein
MGVMDRGCAVCLQAIADGERWFRVREEYVHLSCSEKYLRVVSERRQHAKAASVKQEPESGD